MKLSDLKPASQLANTFGVKCIVYGAPGTGKTPLVATAPRPVMCVCEPGMLSMRNVKNVPAWEANTIAKIDEFFEWIKSAEAKSFDTICIDSISEMAELSLTKEAGSVKDKRQAYGAMKEYIYTKLTQLYYTKEKNTYLIAKMHQIEEEGVLTKRPYFPGKELNNLVPHMYDEVLNIGLNMIGGINHLSIRTKSSFGVFARDRSGKLDELERPDIGFIFNKCLQ